MTTKSALSLGFAASLLLPPAGCQRDAQAWGEANAIIVIAMDSLWQEVGDSVLRALEPAIRTVRDERTFNVTQISPMDSAWVDLRRFRQVLALGVAGDSWVAPAVSQPDRPAPYIVDEPDVWANDQRVTAVVVSAERAAADVRSQLPALGARLDSMYRSYATARMYQSEVNQPLFDSLAATAGFTLSLPKLYRLERHDSQYVFLNWTNVGGELRRTITVAWRTGVDTTTSSETALAWRDSTLSKYVRPQLVAPLPLQRRRVQLGRLTAFEVQGAWSMDYDGVPMGGPFITRLIPCPDQDRTYLVDAWLYAPSREKYEYMIQLETLLNSFRCGSDVVPASTR